MCSSCAYDCCAPPEEQRVLDRECRTPRELACEGEVEVAEAPARLARAERDRAQHPAPRLERHDDVRHRLQAAIELEVLLVDRGVRERLLPCILDEVRVRRWPAPARPDAPRSRPVGSARGARAATAPRSGSRCAITTWRSRPLARRPCRRCSSRRSAVRAASRARRRSRRVDRRREDGARLVEELRSLAACRSAVTSWMTLITRLDGRRRRETIGVDRTIDQRSSPLRQEPVADEALLRLGRRRSRAGSGGRRRRAARDRRR